jgi:hypothetical protein
LFCLSKEKFLPAKWWQDTKLLRSLPHTPINPSGGFVLAITGQCTLRHRTSKWLHLLCITFSSLLKILWWQVNTQPSQRQMALGVVYSDMDSGAGTPRINLIPKSLLTCSFPGAYEGNRVERIIAFAADCGFRSEQPLGYQAPGNQTRK